MNIILSKKQVVFCNKRIDWVKEDQQDLFTVVFPLILVATGLLEVC